jgi:hypothetical protein
MRLTIAMAGRIRALRPGPGLVCLMLASVALGAMWSPSASARTVYTHPYLESFDGAGSVGAEGPTGPFESIERLAIDQSSHSLYVLDHGNGSVLDKFDTNGIPQPFTGLAPGVTSAPFDCAGGESDLAVDNSGSATAGRIYGNTGCGSVRAFEPSGVQLGGNYPLNVGGACGVAVDPAGGVWVADFQAGLRDFTADGTSLGDSFAPVSCHSVIDASQPPDPLSGYFYVGRYGDGGPNVDVYDASRNYVRTLFTDAGTVRAVAADSINHHVYVDTGGHVDEFDAATGALLGIFGFPSTGHGLPNGLCDSASGVAYDDTTQKVFVADCGRVAVFGPGETEILPSVVTDQALTQQSSATLRGHVDPDGGGDTVECYFEWGDSTFYGSAAEAPYGEIAPCVPGTIHTADGNTQVTADLVNLTEGHTYHTRLIATNANGPTIGGETTFRAQQPPSLSQIAVTDIKSDGATLGATISPNGGSTHYRFEWGLDSSYGSFVPVPDGQLDSATQPQDVAIELTNLARGTEYHFRLVAENGAGESSSDDIAFTTFATTPEIVDACPNANVREQTRASGLLDCRAYELVSSANAGGNDVQSDLNSGESTLPAYPFASDRVLYSMHFGEVPGVSGSPTNFGLEPYVARRTAGGWVTGYAGLPSVGIPSLGPYGSPLASVDANLTVFAFAGDKLCSPCFADGKTGVPIRRADGSIVQGMAGSLDPGPSAAPSGYIGQSLSADGTHFVFGSTARFEPDANENGDITIYDRDLVDGITHVVSKTPAPGGSTMTGNGIGELAMSADGARIVFGRTLSMDAAGNRYWHLYMNMGDSDHSADLTPGAATGAIFDGMSADGSSVFFTTSDQLLPGVDLDSSPDIYEASVDGAGSIDLSLISLGEGTGNTDACSPVANLDGNHWNAVGASAAANCGTVAIAGGGGVPRDGGVFYFLSPERLDGPSHGLQNQPNLYAAAAGEAPRFVATLDSENAMIRHAVADSEVRRYGDFQTTATGGFAAFASGLPPADPENGTGHSQIYRYDFADGSVVCASCPPTGATVSSDTTLAPQGLNLSNDGRVFFSTNEQLVLRDIGRKRDVYEWENGQIGLISTGISETDTSLLSASPDGVDAYFFTRESLAPQDKNGFTAKVYDAREGGGFTFSSPLVPCQASDECHGPGTETAPPPDIGTYEGTGGNFPAAGKRPRRHKHRHRHPRHQGKKRAQNHKHKGTHR